MHLVKEIVVNTLHIKIYSLNPDLTVDVDSSLFENMSDSDIQDVVFNQIGADQVDIFDTGRLNDLRSYAVI